MANYQYTGKSVSSVSFREGGTFVLHPGKIYELPENSVVASMVCNGFLQSVAQSPKKPAKKTEVTP